MGILHVGSRPQDALQLCVKKVNVYIAQAPAGVAAAGLELRKLLEESIRLLRNYRL